MPMNLKLTVTNHGDGAALPRSSAVTKSDEPDVRQQGARHRQARPGQDAARRRRRSGGARSRGTRSARPRRSRRTRRAMCRIPKDALMRADGVKLHFEEARGHAPADAEMRVTVKSLERPTFAYSYEIIDNRDGQRRRARRRSGEELTMYLTVKNVGQGPLATRRRRTCGTSRARGSSSTTGASTSRT